MRIAKNINSVTWLCAHRNPTVICRVTSHTERRVGFKFLCSRATNPTYNSERFAASYGVSNWARMFLATRRWSALPSSRIS